MITLESAEANLMPPQEARLTGFDWGIHVRAHLSAPIGDGEHTKHQYYSSVYKDSVTTDEATEYILHTYEDIFGGKVAPGWEGLVTEAIKGAT